jgi:hypothetical protein
MVFAERMKVLRMHQPLPQRGQCSAKHRRRTPQKQKLFFCLLGGVRCGQWQAGGNISAANHTLIWSTIQSGLTTYVPDASSSRNHKDLA